MNHYLQCKPRRILFVAIAGISALPALAQETLILEEVVVTAMKRETSLMETATAVSSFDAAARQELGIDNGFDLAVHTPSLNYVPSRISIRGVGRANIGLGSDPGVGIYLDGVYNTETDIFSYSNFLDIERIEVLRGPQGTLYGRNSIGGAVNFISTQHDHDEWGGKVLAEVGNYDYLVAQGLASGPITQKLSGVFALSQIQRGGLQENEGSAVRFDEEESSYGSISLQHLSTDNWTNTLKAFKRNSDVRRRQPYILDPYTTDYIQQNDVSAGEPASFPGIFPGNSFANGYQGATRQNPALQDESDVSVDYRPSEKQRKWAASFISEYDFEQFTLKYTGGYADFSYDEEYDADGMKASESGLNWDELLLSGIPVSTFTGTSLTPAFTVRSFDQSNTNWSHDLQIITDLDGAINFIGGLYYYNSKETQNAAFRELNDELMATYSLFGGFRGLPVSDDNYLFRGESELETTSYAAYGQMDWSFSYSTVLTLGLRYSYDKKDGSDNTFVQWVGDVDDPTVYRNIEDSWDKVTWRVGLDHSLSDNHFLYGFVATGYRSGGFSLGVPRESTEVDTVDPEDLLSYEIGYKGSLADNRVNLTTALYYYDYTNIQVLKDELVNGVAVPIYENAADANAWGLEVGVDALLTQRLSLLGTYSYNSTEYEDYQSVDSSACALGPLAEGNSLAPLCTQEQDLKGNQFARTPENQVALNLIYQWQMATLDWRAVGVYSYVGDQWSTSFNNDDYDLVNAYDRWDARLSIGSPKLTWELTAYVKNITGTREQFQRDRPSTVSQLADSRLIDPRIYGLRFAYNF